MSALTAARRPQSREAALAGQAGRSLVCVEARQLPSGSQPLWRVLERACRRASSGTLQDKGLRLRIDHGLGYLEYLRSGRLIDGELQPAWGEARAFDSEVVLAYQDWVANLAKQGSVPPGKFKPPPRPAEGDEERLDLVTQQIKLRSIGFLWEIARVHPDLASEFTPLPPYDPTKLLTWKKRTSAVKTGIAFSLAELWATPFVSGHRRSAFTHERNLVLATLYACNPSRNNELRRACWTDLEVWEVREGAELPVRRWPIEAALSGEATLDDDRFVLFLTLAEDSSKTEWRSFPIVGVAAERLLAYATHRIDAQLESLRYLRYRARRELSAALRAEADGDAQLLMCGEVMSVPAFRANPDLWRRARAFSGAGFLQGSSGATKLSPSDAEAIRTVLWSIAAKTHFESARTALDNGTPIRGVFDGCIFASSEGGPLSEDQLQKIWKDNGWTRKGWGPQQLRRNAARAFERVRLDALAPLGPVVGHKDPRTTVDHYGFAEPWVKVHVVRQLQMGLV